MPKNRTAEIIQFPTAASERNKIRRTAARARKEEAAKAGWIYVNADERALIRDVLRWTSYHGRSIVYDVARQMQRAHPWSATPAGGGRHG